jgi:hypothetical protein
MSIGNVERRKRKEKMKPQNGVVLNCSECLRRGSNGVRPFFVQGLWKYKMKTDRFFRLLCAVLLFAVAWVVLSSRTLAYSIYELNTTGNDISYPQCSTDNYPQSAFGIIGVTGGKSFTANPCLSKEFTWADALSKPPSLYMNLNAPIGPTASKGMTGHYGNCTKKDKSCQARNYGHKAAQYAFDYATDHNVSSPMWWLDIEIANSWSSDTHLNQETINGAVQFFRDRGGKTVGIYSTPRMWRSITGGYINHLPVWLPAGLTFPAIYCSSKYAFTGGTVYLVQYISNGFDTNYVC